MEARIRQIDVRLARFPLAEPFSSSVVRVDAVHLALVELHGPDESGIAYGFGFSRSDAALIAAAVRELAEFAIGHDLFATGALWQRMHAALAFSGRGGAGLAALSVIDMAAWDARARHLGLPLAKLIGSARDAVPAYGSSGSLSLSPQALAEEMAGFARAGYSRMKLKLGPSLRENRLRLRAVRDAVGEDAELYVDGNQQWGLPAALAMARGIAEFRPAWIEEPLPAGQIGELAELRRLAGIPVATGETNFGLEDFDRILAHRAADIVMPNLQRIGGVTAWLRVAAAAELRGLAIASHVHMPFALPLLCAAPNGLCLENVPWWPHPFETPVRIENGMAIPSAEPGFGLRFDEALLKAFLV